MTAKKKSTRLTNRQLALAAVTGPSTKLAYSALLISERPTSANSLFTRCRKVATESSFLTIYLPLKQSFYNYGLEFTPGPLGKGDSTALDKWLQEDFTAKVEYEDPATRQTTEIELNQTRGEAIRSIIRDVWAEYLLLDNVVLQWFDGNATAPLTLAPERCRYQEKLGMPLLWYTHGLSAEEIKLLPQDQQERYTKNAELLLSPAEGEHFKVLKRGLAGTGFAKPTLYSLLRTLGEIESKEIGFHARAWQMRGSMRQIKVGHEIKQGTHAGKGTWFWNAKRDAAVRAELKDREGPYDWTANFDHDITFPWPDAEHFDDTMWKGTDLRCRNWGGPVAQMVLSDKVVEGGLQFLKAMVSEDRRLVADLVRPAIKAVFNPPENLDMQVTWSDLIFNNPGQAAELLKFATQQGLASWHTARRMMGLNPSTEDAQKLKEADDADGLKKFTPAFDMSHGTAPALGVLELGGGDQGTPAKGKGANPGNKNGRPAGSETTP